MDRVAFLGLGTMGAAMAANLARAGFPVTAWNRTAGRAAELDELGVARAASPAAAAGEADIVVICVSDTPDVEAVLFGPMGSSRAPGPARSSSIARRSPRPGSWDFAARLRERGLRMVDAPGLRRQRGRPQRDPDDLRRR